MENKILKLKITKRHLDIAYNNKKSIGYNPYEQCLVAVAAYEAFMSIPMSVGFWINPGDGESYSSWELQILINKFDALLTDSDTGYLKLRAELPVTLELSSYGT